MDIKVLVADDDLVLRSLVCDIIKKQGYIPIEAADGRQAVNIFFAAQDIDLIILDVMMPQQDGWAVLKEIREYADVPIIMLTALDDRQHEVMGLKKGADDYIAKPFSYEVFVARLNALLRKVKKERMEIIVAGDIQVDQMTHHVFIKGIETVLDRKEYYLLIFLLKNRKCILTREQILATVWGFDFDGDIRTIDTHIKTLRSKLGSCGEYIKTARGVGYFFEVTK
jgi:two-component system, OmpR family, response regulator ResD